MHLLMLVASAVSDVHRCGHHVVRHCRRSVAVADVVADARRVPAATSRRLVVAGRHVGQQPDCRLADRVSGVRRQLGRQSRRVLVLVRCGRKMLLLLMVVLLVVVVLVHHAVVLVHLAHVVGRRRRAISASGLDVRRRAGRAGGRGAEGRRRRRGRQRLKVGAAGGGQQSRRGGATD